MEATANRLTEEQQKTYIESGGVICPFCKVGNIEGGRVEIDNGIASQGVNCTDCGEEWTDVYTLTSVTTEYN